MEYSQQIVATRLAVFSCPFCGWLTEMVPGNSQPAAEFDIRRGTKTPLLREAVPHPLDHGGGGADQNFGQCRNFCRAKIAKKINTIWGNFWMKTPKSPAPCGRRKNSSYLGSVRTMWGKLPPNTDLTHRETQKFPPNQTPTPAQTHKISVNGRKNHPQDLEDLEEGRSKPECNAA